MTIARIGDIDVAYETFGSDQNPPLLAIMGLTGSRWHWRRFPERFADAYRVITFDNRGVGESSVPRPPYTAAQMANDALGLMDHLGIEKAVILGVSMGGMIAQELALKAPERVTKLVLGCTSFGGAKAIPPPQETTDAFASVGKGGGEAGLRRLVELNWSKAAATTRSAEITELVQYGLSNRMTPPGFHGQMMAVVTHDTQSRLSALKPPTLLVTGDEDLLIPPTNSNLLANQIPGAQVVVLEKTGHMFWIESAAEAETAIRQFLGTTRT
jgi:pimeloyl-ACP methyl ester carboxylesterase